jgi:pyridoxine 5-phosphate synthase
MPRLSVNLNKFALLRNSRGTGVPDVLEFAQIAVKAGATGVTVHPRPDERHITGHDVLLLADWLRPMRPRIELNVEGYPDERLRSLLLETLPEQCTLVPDGPNALTSSEGWQCTEPSISFLRSILPEFRRVCGRLIVFVDPKPEVVHTIATLPIDGVEIYTGGFARAVRCDRDQIEAQIAAVEETVRVAAARGLIVNIGHDLDRENLELLRPVLPLISEASIGHELLVDAIRAGYADTVRGYVESLGETRPVESH